MTRSIRVAHVDDDSDYQLLTKSYLERIDPNISIVPIENPSAILNHDLDEFDCIISDYDMPGTDGIELLETIRKRDTGLPFILFTGKGSEEVASEAISTGVTDYLQKGGDESVFTVLANRITNSVEQYHSSQELQQSQARIELFFEESPLGVIEWDESFRIARMNKTAGDILGYSRSDLVGESWKVIVPESDQSEVAKVISELQDGTGGFYHLTENIRNDGEHIICEWHNRVIRKESGENLAIYSQFQDVTERYNRERELERYETIIETVGDGVYVLNPNGEYTYVNSYIESRTGFSRSEILGKHAEEFLTDPDLEAVEASIREMLSGDRAIASHEIDVRTIDGHTIPAEIRLTTLLDGGEFIGTVGIMRDISDRLDRKRQLEQYETIIETAADSIYALDANGNFSMVNNRLLERTGYSREELIGSHVSIILDEDDIQRGEEKIRSMVTEPENSVFAAYEATAHRSNGETYPIELRIAPLFEDEEFTGTVGISRDISNRIDREAQLERQNERLERFVSVVSHDLRNPLNVAFGYLDLLRNQYDDPHFDDVERSLDRMEKLIEDLLTLSREGERVSDSSKVDLESAVTSCWQNIERSNATLEVYSSHTIHADRSQLSHVFENLFQNAIKHGGSSVTITVGDLADGFFVEDDGMGISEDHKAHIFERGFSTSTDGTGFGLSIVEEIIESHGWHLSVTQGPNGGARFEITGVCIVSE